MCSCIFMCMKQLHSDLCKYAELNELWLWRVFSQYKCHFIIWCYNSISVLQFKAQRSKTCHCACFRNLHHKYGEISFLLVMLFRYSWLVSKVKMKLFEIKFCSVHHRKHMTSEDLEYESNVQLLWYIYGALVTFLKAKIFRISKGSGYSTI